MDAASGEAPTGIGKECGGCPLLELPPELRNRIWEMAIVGVRGGRTWNFVNDKYNYKRRHPALLHTSKQVRSEVIGLWYAGMGVGFANVNLTDHRDAAIQWLEWVGVEALKHVRRALLHGFWQYASGMWAMADVTVNLDVPVDKDALVLSTNVDPEHREGMDTMMQKLVDILAEHRRYGSKTLRVEGWEKMLRTYQQWCSANPGRLRATNRRKIVS